MSHLAYDADDAAIIAFVDQWVALLAAEEYDQAFAMTAHAAGSTMTPSGLRDLVKLHATNHATYFESAYGVLVPAYRVTPHGAPTHKTQRKDVDRWPKNARGTVGEVWYDLNFDGFVTDYTATFEIQDDGHGLTIALQDIGVH